MRAISAASASASPRASPCLTTRLARPMAKASIAPTGRPVRIMSSARRLADQPGQAHRAAVDQRHAPAPAEDAEHRILLGHAQIAPAGKLQPAGHRMARNRRDHGLGELEPRRAHRRVAGQRIEIRARSGRLGAVAAALGDGLQVRAGAERAAGAPQHRNRLAVVALRKRGRPGPGPRPSAGRRRCAPAGRFRITVVTGPDFRMSDGCGFGHGRVSSLGRVVTSLSRALRAGQRPDCLPFAAYGLVSRGKSHWNGSSLHESTIRPFVHSGRKTGFHFLECQPPPSEARRNLFALGNLRDHPSQQFQSPPHDDGGRQELCLFQPRRRREERPQGHFAAALFAEGAARKPAAQRRRHHRHHSTTSRPWPAG